MRATDRDHLLSEQYRTGSRLRSRRAFHERYSTNPRSESLWLFDQLGLSPEARVLEVGCGTGAFWSANATRIPTGWSLELTDLSPAMVREARESLASLRPAPEFLSVDVQRLPFDPASFDAVLAHYVLYHVPALERAISEISRVLTPGGRLYAAAHGAGYMREWNDLARVLDPEVDGRRRSFDLENGEAVLRRRFGTVEVRPYADALEVSDPEAVVNYLLSGVPAEAATAERLETLRRAVEERWVREGGTLRCSNSSGLFIAAEPRP